VGFDPHAALAKRRADGATVEPANTSDDNTSALTAPLTGAAASPCEPLRETDPDLARIVNAWPELPAHIRAAVLALVQTTG